MNKNIIPKMDYVNFFDNINSYTSFERKRILSDLTDGFDLNLLTEFSNSFVQYCFLKFNDINKSLSYIEPIEAEAGAMRLNEIHFPFYEFIKNEIYKEVRIEVFNNISFEQCIQFNKILDFLDEIETIIENQSVKIINTTPEAVKPDEVLENLHKTIFKNDIGFTIFTKMKEYYSDTKTPQADYSFLFDIMQKDGFAICTGAKFIDFLKEFDICITKIDSFKTGNKQKTKLYNATKEYLQKKHGLSTI